MVNGDVDGERRRIYRREGSGYPSDMRDAEWARLARWKGPVKGGVVGNKLGDAIGLALS